MKSTFSNKKYFLKALSFSLVLSFCLTTGCNSPISLPRGNSAEKPRTGADIRASSPTFGAFADDFFIAQVSSNTISLHFTLANPENYGIEETPISLGDISALNASKTGAKIENTLATLEGYDYDALPVTDRLTYDVLSGCLTAGLAATKFMLYDEILRPSTGIQTQLPVLYEEYRFHDRSDIGDYLKLIALTDGYFSQIIEFEQKKANAGLFMSDYACDKIIAQCENFVENPDSHYLITTFDRKIDAMAELTGAERTLYKTKNAALVKENILPAYQKLSAALSGLFGSGKNDKGLCYFPDGKKYYEYLVALNTGSQKKIPDIQKRISEKRAADLTAAGTLLSEDPDLKEQLNPAALSGMDAIATLNHLKQEMLKQFPPAPDTEFTVSYIDESMEEYMAPAFYITSPIDDYSEKFDFHQRFHRQHRYALLYNARTRGLPGHLYQTVMSYEAGLPPVRSILNFAGYVEGWATYVEMISYHYAGLLENAAELMSLNQSALLSLYASTDFGIHYDGWSFGDMLAFWKDYGITDQKALREVYELIVGEPAHYLKYYVGYLEFLELKEKAKEAYGSNYSDVAFHQAVLDIGPAPFAIIEKYLDYYYKAAE